MEVKLSALTLLLCIAVSHAGMSYIRWGRSVCPQGQIVLYKGYMTGDHYLGRGNGANMLCSSQNPKFVRGVAGIESIGHSAKLWGVEAQITAEYKNLFLGTNVASGNVNDQDMLCVRCYVSSASDIFMLPGRDDCEDSGYDLMYKGFLVAQAQWADRQSQEYLCLDEAPEGRVGGDKNDNQGVFYPVQYVCGSLPCNPYVSGMEATCAVCSY